ncbi:MAG: penicillin acylase family protein [Planctomycetota bacterium]
MYQDEQTVHAMRCYRSSHARSSSLYLAWAVVAAGALLITTGCGLTPPSVGSINGEDRLSKLDQPWPGLQQAVDIYWDQHLIPTIVAQTDQDVAYSIGLVHAHLRMSQMDFFRKVSQGRLSEMAGPFTVEIDEALRAIDLARAVDEIEAGLPEETRSWLEAYVAGINNYRVSLTQRPHDARVLGLEYDEPWKVRDVLTFGRLASVDVNWGRWLSLSEVKTERGYEDYIRRLWAFADKGMPSFSPSEPHDLSLINSIGRTGSNAIVVSGERSASGGALVASDPHLGLIQPNIWCVVGYHTPQRSVVGLSIPGLPFVLIGRNERIAWTGTNMQSSSSVLYRLKPGWEEKPPREEAIGVRYWFDAHRTIRESELGPVVSDAGLLGGLGQDDIVLRWRGHEPSDESSAFLNAARTKDWAGFRSAFADYRVGGQNMLYGDAGGNIGQVMAIEAIPAAARASRLGPVPADNPGFAWSKGSTSDQLPAAYNPEAGFLVSANNVPTRMTAPLVPLGNANDRVTRVQSILNNRFAVTLNDLAELQLDTYSAASHRLAKLIVSNTSHDLLAIEHRWVRYELEAWDGRYESDSTGAIVYQGVLSRLVQALYEDNYGPRIIDAIRSGAYIHDFVAEDLQAADHEQALKQAIEDTAEDTDRSATWGDVHRLRVAHTIGAAPLIGRGYVYDDLPYSGTTSVVAKAAHSVSTGRHNSTYGANARLLCDMGTLDNNRVVLLGGQDGWIGSDRMLDMLPYWVLGETISLPLSLEAQRQRAVRVIRIEPE